MKPKQIPFLSAYIVIEIGFRSYGIQSDCCAEAIGSSCYTKLNPAV